MIIDDVAPNPPFALVRSRMIEADLPTTMAALSTANLVDQSSVRALSWVRDAPNRVLARWRGEPVEAVPSYVSFGELAESGTFKVLGTAPDQYVAGAIGRFWQRDYGWVDFDPAEFAAFDQPGYAKTVIGFHAVPRGPGRTMLVYESRTVVTDDDARRRFARYWTPLQPFVAFMLNAALRAIAREAEQPDDADIIELRRSSPPTSTTAMTHEAR